MCVCVCRRPVYVKGISGRFDVGNLQSYMDSVNSVRERQPTIAVLVALILVYIKVVLHHTIINFTQTHSS